MSARTRPGLRAGLAALLAVAGLCLASATLHAQAQGPPRYSFLYHGRLHTMTPDPDLVALPETPGTGAAFALPNGLVREPVSGHDDLEVRRLGVYRAPRGKAGGVSPRAAQARGAALAAARVPGQPPAQPVFEDGGNVLLPTDEVLVGFHRPLRLDQARALLAPLAGRIGLADVLPGPGPAFRVRIAAPGDGRAFEVARALAGVRGVRYAEPNLLVVRQYQRPGPPDPGTRIPPADHTAPLAPQAGGGSFTPQVPNGSQAQLRRPGGLGARAVPTWTTVHFEGFEGAVAWTVGKATGAPDVVPSIVTNRAVAGTKSLYMTGNGTQGVPPPGPYPNNVNCFAASPVLNLAGFEEAYVEFWFFARYEDPGQTFFDYGQAFIFHGASGSSLGRLLAVPFTGNLTSDPTTFGGWRRCLMRVPPPLRQNGIQIVFTFNSDVSIGAEGLYIDNVWVGGTADVDTEPISNDTYSARQYEYRNSGQVAALGNDNQDLNAPAAWAQQPVSSSLIVAVIDDGVDLLHPDLNLVGGFDAETGAAGGGPRDSESNHGTACAGNVGARGGNSIGTVGSAPGVKIMPISWATLGGAANAFNLAVAGGAKVLSNSWGGVSLRSQTVEDAIAAAIGQGRVVLFAAGNGPDRPPWTYQIAWPGGLAQGPNATLAQLICVGASSLTDQHKAAASTDGYFTWGSSFVAQTGLDGPDVVAPGPWSYTTDRRGNLGYNTDSNISGVDTDWTHDFGGTSSSTPKVAGIAALLCSRNPNLTSGQVKNLLRQTATDIDAQGEDDKTGTGRVDALAALNATPVPTFSISGTITLGGAGLAGVTVSLNTGANTATAANGTFSFTGLAAGSYTITPSLAGHAFSPANRQVSLGPDATGQNFTASLNATITVTSPNGGENWTLGSNQTITWNSSGVPGNVKIELSRNGGGAWETIAASVANTGSFGWVPGGAATTQGLIRVSDVGNAAVFDISNAVFSLVQGASITVTSPNGGEDWPVGGSRSITWNSSGVPGNVKIELSRNGGTSFEVLSASAANTGSFNWVVTAPATTQARVRVSDAGNAAVNDVSNANFTISQQTGGSPAVFTIEDGAGAPGGSVQLPLNFQANGAQVTVAGFDLTFDTARLSFTSAARGQLPSGVDVQVQNVSAGRVRVLLFGAANVTPFSTGTLATFTFQLAQGVANGTTTQVRAVLRDTTNAGVEVSDPQGAVANATANPGTVRFGVRGDLNGNGQIDVGDIQIMVNVFLGTVAFNPALHDLNNNGSLDVGDLQTIVNLFLGRPFQSSGAPRAQARGVKTFRWSFHPGTEQVTAFAFDLLLPETAAVQGVVLNFPGRLDLQVDYNQVSPGRWRVLVFSTNATPIPRRKNLLRVTVAGVKKTSPVRPNTSTPGADAARPDGSIFPLPYGKKAVKRGPGIG